MLSLSSHPRTFSALLVAGLALSLPAGLMAGADSPRTASGRPDLTGTYDAATLTPLTRPAGFGNNLYLSREEAEELAEKQRLHVEENAQASDPDREAPPDGGDGSPGPAGNVGGYNDFWIDQGTDVFTIDGKFRTSIIIDPENGQMPPMTPDGQKMMAKLISSFTRRNEGKAWWLDKDGPGPYDNMEQRDNAERCMLGFSGAAPSIPSFYNNYKTIVQTDDYVLILIEMVHDARIVRMNSEHLPAEITNWLGDSIGWWEGDTLVVDTTNFSSKAGGFLGGADKHVVERFSRLDDGNVLYNFTMEDDSTWTAPWTGEYVWRSSEQKLYEYACHEGNYALGNIMRGARLLEEQTLEAQQGGGD